MGSEHNAADATKLIIVMALRTGAVAETSWDALYVAMRGRSPKAIEWAHPERPLFNAYLKGAVGLDFSRPAIAKQQAATLQLAGELIDLLSTPWTHDLRRGAAADIAHLPQPLLFGTSTPAVGRALGHLPNATEMAVTDGYIGRSREDNWSLRLDAAEKNIMPDNFGLTFGATPFRPRKRKPDEVTAACVRFDTDPNDPKAPHKAKHRLRAEMKEDWVKESIAARGQQQPTSSASNSPARTEANPPPNLALSDLVPPHLAPFNMAPLDATALDSARIDAVEIDSDPNVSLDPALLVLGDYLFGSSSDVTASTPEVNLDVTAETLFVTDANDGLSENMASLDNMDDHEAADILTSDRDVFVTYFSKINAMALSHRLRDNCTPKRFIDQVGGSRDPPTLFTYACPNKPYGCTWTGPAKTRYNDHFRSCKSTSTEAHLALAKKKDVSSSTSAKAKAHLALAKKKDVSLSASAEAHPEPAEGKPVECTIDGCKSTFRSKRHLAQHLIRGHRPPFTERRCGAAGCVSDEVFKTQGALDKHCRAAHSGWIPRRCGVGGCKCLRTFEDPKKLRRHLRTVHKLNDEGVKQYELLHGSVSVATTQRAAPG